MIFQFGVVLFKNINPVTQMVNPPWGKVEFFQVWISSDYTKCVQDLIKMPFQSLMSPGSELWQIRYNIHL